MKISIALATFNGAAYLREQLDSIKRQSLQPDELVVSDDSSSDDTVEIARQFARVAGFEVKVDAHSKLGNYNENFVRAIGQCTGDIVALCDQDDVWSQNKLATACAEFQDDAVMAVSHRVEVVNERLQPMSLVLPQTAFHGTFSVDDLDPWFAPGGLQLFFRRAPIAPLLLDAPPLSKWFNAPAPFDEWIFFLASLLGKRVVLPDVLGVWRRHSTSTTGSVEATKKAWSPAYKLELAVSSGSAAYTFAADVADSRAEVAERVARDTARPAPNAEAGVAFYRQLSSTWRRRSELHEVRSSRAARLMILTDMMRKMDYRRRNTGGLGARSLLKDSFAVVRGPRKPQP